MHTEVKKVTATGVAFFRPRRRRRTRETDGTEKVRIPRDRLSGQSKNVSRFVRRVAASTRKSPHEVYFAFVSITLQFPAGFRPLPAARCRRNRFVHKVMKLLEETFDLQLHRMGDLEDFVDQRIKG